MENKFQTIDSYSDYKIFENLTNKEKLLVKLIYIEHWSISSISINFGISKSTIYSQLKRIKKKVKNNLE